MRFLMRVWMVFGILMSIQMVNPKLRAQEKGAATGEKGAPAGVVDDVPWESLFEPREYSDEQGRVLKYRLMKPVDYHSNKKYPLVIFLHGAGERGEDNQAQLKHGVKNFASAENRSKYPCFMVVPQCPTGEKWSNVDWSAKSSKQPAEASQPMQMTVAIVKSMIDSSGVDRTRIYVTGLSMGGYGTWDVLGRYPEWIAAAAPICGGGDPAMAERFQQVPLWAFHGGKDTVVKPERSREMIEALKKAGANPKYTEYPEAGHDSWTETYSNPAFLEWMFAQRKKQEPAAP